MAFLEEYTLLDELGQGGYATVYKVRHNKLRYIRAIRVLNAIIARESDKAYQDFLDECRTLLRLGNGNHPNIVHIYQPLLLAQRAIVEMDYVDGQDILHYLKGKTSFVETRDVIKLLTDIGSALAYCHEDIYKYCMDKDEDGLKDDPNDGSKPFVDEHTRQRLIKKYRVIHNDIHSGNIIRREDGSFVLLDFGLAIDGEKVVRSSRRKNGAPEFKAPEKWDNDSILTTQSDIYSFGVVLYEFLAGRVPFVFNKQNSNQTEEEYLLSKAHKEQRPESIYKLRKEVFERSHPGEQYQRDYPEWLEDVIMKCLAKRPEDRFRNGKELFNHINQYRNYEASYEGGKSEKNGDAYENKLKELRTSLSSYQEGYARLQEDLRESTISKESLYKEVRNLTKENASLRGQVKELEGLSTDNKGIIQSISNELNESKKKLEEAQSEISRLNNKINTIPPPDSSGRKWRALFFAFLSVVVFAGAFGCYYHFEDIRWYQNSNREYEITIDSLQVALNYGGQTAIISNLQQQIKEKDNSIRSLSSQVNELEKKIRELNVGTGNSEETAQLRSKISTLEQQIQTYKTRISALESSSNNYNESTVKQLNSQIAELRNQLTQKNKEIQELTKERDVLRAKLFE